MIEPDQPRQNDVNFSLATSFHDKYNHGLASKSSARMQKLLYSF